MTPLRTLYIAIALSFISIAQAQQPSSIPCGTPSCPSQDKDGLVLGNGSDSNGVLFCPYAAAGEHNFENLHCTYNDCNSRRFKREDNYTALLRKRKAAAEARARSDPRKTSTLLPS
ncbi:hypothetical protein K438DRAFT_1863969, partial [Mycena galopus ATCC 62051]